MPKQHRYINYYKCPSCYTEWHDSWSCQCNDRCPECDTECEPIDSELNPSYNGTDEDEEE